jgi:tRNA threonylcarbamoyladenosine biosynthesis protein TsaE
MTDTEPPAETVVELPDEQATGALAARLAPALGPGLLVTLSGGLGVGKTTFVRGLLRSLGYNGRVRSPTFTLLEPYNLPKFPVYHFDFYRFSSEDEWREAGFGDYFGGDGVCLVEWPERAGAGLPTADLQLALEFRGDAADGAGARTARLRGLTAAGRRCVTAVARC